MTKVLAGSWVADCKRLSLACGLAIGLAASAIALTQNQRSSPHAAMAVAYKSLGNTVSHTLDGMGNRMAEQVESPSGNLQRNITRVYDALNRIQQVTGALN
jgi:hypothetical protein